MDLSRIDVVIIPITGSKEYTDLLISKSQELEAQLSTANIRVIADYKHSHKAQWKFKMYEDAHVPLRIEVGLRDLHLQRVLVVRSDTNMKYLISFETIVDEVKRLLLEITY